MKKRGWILCVLLVFFVGCSSSSDTPTTSTASTPKTPQQQVLNMCVKILEAEKNGDESMFMSLIPKDSPDYEYLLSTSQKRKSLDYMIYFYGCKLKSLDGDTAKVEVIYDYELNDQPAVMSVMWTFKNRNNNWVYWHGSR